MNINAEWCSRTTEVYTNKLQCFVSATCDAESSDGGENDPLYPDTGPVVPGVPASPALPLALLHPAHVHDYCDLK